MFNRGNLNLNLLSLVENYFFSGITAFTAAVVALTPVDTTDTPVETTSAVIETAASPTAITEQEQKLRQIIIANAALEK